MTSEPTTLEQWTHLAGNLQLRTGVFIDGGFRAAASGATFDSINPATGEVLAAVAAADEVDVDAAVVSARASFESGVVVAEPRPLTANGCCIRLAELIIEHRAELALLDSMDMGKLVTEANNVDVPSAAELFAFYGEALDKINGEIAPTEPGNLALVTREPLGVVGAVTPVELPTRPRGLEGRACARRGQQRRAQTRRAGTAVVAAAGRTGRRGRASAGRAERGPGLGPSRGRAHWACTPTSTCWPSPARPRPASGSCATRPTPISSRCGWNAAARARTWSSPTPTWSRPSEKAIFGAFYNQGAVCSSNSRLLVAASIAEQFIADLVERAATMRPAIRWTPRAGTGCDRRRSAHRPRARVRRSRPARKVRSCRAADANGRRPRLFHRADDRHRSRADRPNWSPRRSSGRCSRCRRSTTRPRRSGWPTTAIYGLAASVWTNDLRRAHTVAAALRAGTVSVNTVDALSAQTPFGGFKQSGFGRDLSLHALDKYTGLKTTWIRF